MIQCQQNLWAFELVLLINPAPSSPSWQTWTPVCRHAWWDEWWGTIQQWCAYLCCTPACVRAFAETRPSISTVSSVGTSLVFLSLLWGSTGKCALQWVLRTSWEEGEEEKGLAPLFTGDKSFLVLMSNFQTAVTPSPRSSEGRRFSSFWLWFKWLIFPIQSDSLLLC